jgi:hypothetical protein
VRFAKPATSEEQPDRPVAGRRKLGVARAQYPIIGTPGATFDQVANKGCVLSRIELGKGSAQAMHALDFATEQVLGHGEDLNTQTRVSQPARAR